MFSKRPGHQSTTISIVPSARFGAEECQLIQASLGRFLTSLSAGSRMLGWQGNAPCACDLRRPVAGWPRNSERRRRRNPLEAHTQPYICFANGPSLVDLKDNLSIEARTLIASAAFFFFLVTMVFDSAGFQNSPRRVFASGVPRRFFLVLFP